MKKYNIYFSDGEKRIMFEINAENENEAYFQARDKLEKDYKVKCFPYFLIKEMKNGKT